MVSGYLRAARARSHATRPRRAAARDCRSFWELPVVGVGAQHFDELSSGAMQATLHGAERRVRDVGDLLVTETLGVTKNEHRAVLIGQAVQLALQALDA